MTRFRVHSTVLGEHYHCDVFVGVPCIGSDDVSWAKAGRLVLRAAEADALVQRLMGPGAQPVVTTDLDALREEAR